MQDCRKMCDKLDIPSEEVIQNINQALGQLAEYNLSVKSHCNKAQVENLFIKIRANINKYQAAINAFKENIENYHEIFSKTTLQLNRLWMARTPVYSSQVQQCFEYNKLYIYIKWCKFCDCKRFQQQFNNQTSNNSIINSLIHESQLSIKYSNRYIQWIPYEQFNEIEEVGKGGFAKVYKAIWYKRLGT